MKNNKVLTKLRLHLRAVLNILVKLLMESGREKVGNYGPMALFIKESGTMIWPMEKECFGSLMVGSMKAILKMIDSME